MSPIKPMLAKKAEEGKVPTGDEFLYEIKWDGLRAIIEIKDREVRIFSRSGKEITAQYPELLECPTEMGSGECVLDAEIVCFDENGLPSFRTAVGRRHNANANDIARRAKEAPATAVVFDIVKASGIDIKNETYEKRREALTMVLREDSRPRYIVSDASEDGEMLYEFARENGLEGIIAKQRDGKYLEGKRSTGWLKVKVQNFEDVRIVGYTLGEGRREQWFGALLIETMDGKPCGRVGTGLNDQMLADLREAFDMIGFEITSNKDQRFLKKPLIAEVKYMNKTVHGNLREPVFMKLRTDMAEG